MEIGTPAELKRVSVRRPSEFSNLNRRGLGGCAVSTVLELERDTLRAGECRKEIANAGHQELVVDATSTTDAHIEDIQIRTRRWRLGGGILATCLRIHAQNATST